MAVYQVFGVAVTLDQVIVYACVLATVFFGVVVLRYTDVGLKVRAMVDSPAMTDLSGTNPTTISVGVWAVSTLFAGLAGVLAAPIIGLDPDKFTVLIAASFAAVVAARLRNLTGASARTTVGAARWTGRSRRRARAASPGPPAASSSPLAWASSAGTPAPSS